MRQGEKTSVYFDKRENSERYSSILKRARQDRRFLKELAKTLGENWPQLFPYISGKKKLANARQARKYYDALTEWWSAMTLIFDAPNIAGLPKAFGKKALEIRVKYEKYSSSTYKPLEEVWNKLNPGQEQIFPFAMIDEIKKLSPPDLKKIKGRLGGYALFNGKLYTPQELKVQLRKNKIVLEKEVVRPIKNIKGITACSGWAKGKAKIVISKNQFAKFKAGEILVAEMTEPSFVPIIKKAAAIITDEGGVTCHAAIVARELGIPCIIGTKIATKVLHDGDLVEVDADKGIVKIIKK
ncbi:MAG TPA: PEP-utilizing enzyme [Candidatus Nanoarchaeia archaeon]|nr:PEP-utilizing enzyme [Candidatus Nanoarchaeia archaeon]